MALLHGPDYPLVPVAAGAYTVTCDISSAMEEFAQDMGAFNRLTTTISQALNEVAQAADATIGSKANIVQAIEEFAQVIDNAFVGERSVTADITSAMEEFQNTMNAAGFLPADIASAMEEFANSVATQVKNNVGSIAQSIEEFEQEVFVDRDPADAGSISSSMEEFGQEIVTGYTLKQNIVQALNDFRNTAFASNFLGADLSQAMEEYAQSLSAVVLQNVSATIDSAMDEFEQEVLLGNQIAQVLPEFEQSITASINLQNTISQEMEEFAQSMFVQVFGKTVGLAGNHFAPTDVGGLAHESPSLTGNHFSPVDVSGDTE